MDWQKGIIQRLRSKHIAAVSHVLKSVGGKKELMTFVKEQ